MKFDKYLEAGMSPIEAIAAYKRDNPEATSHSPVLKKAAGEMLCRLVDRGMSPQEAVMEVRQAFYQSGFAVPAGSPLTFESVVTESIRQGSTPQQAVRGAAIHYPKLQADYFRRISAGEPDALADVWQ